jgi:NAD(P)-dependent dehydrogenase (short-subunit alcohol dehydrogenase family)
MAQAFAKKGARIACADLDLAAAEAAARMIAKENGAALAFAVDVTSIEGTERLAAAVEQRLGAPQVLINSAGILSGIGPVWEVDPKKWLNDVRVSLEGTYLVSRAVLPAMLSRRSGYILNLFGGGSEPQMYISGYVAAKTGMLMLTECLGREAAEHGIKVFAMRPGPVRTGLNTALVESAEGRKWRPDFARIFEQGGGVSASLVVELALRLVGGEADALTGRLIDAQDDLDRLIAKAKRIEASSDLLRLRITRDRSDE